MEYPIRYIVSILIETESTLAINSGDSTLLLDSTIVRDANGLPYIPATSLAGVLRHLFDVQTDTDIVDGLFGFTSRDGNDFGSRLIFSDAYITQEDGQTLADGLFTIKESNYWKEISTLPERDHVKINELGAATDKAKFDRQLLTAGNRFGFEVELIGQEADKAYWEQLISLFFHPLFRLGAGTRKGAGKIKVLKAVERVYYLESKEQLTQYLEKPSNLNNDLLLEENNFSPLQLDNSSLASKKVELRPKDLFFFGSGIGDKDADNTPKAESIRIWDGQKSTLIEHYLIPASSIKGALSHRTAFHYNQLVKNYIGDEKPLTSNDFDWDINTALKDLQLPELSEWNRTSTKWEEEKAKINALNFEDFVHQSEDWKRFVNEGDRIKKTKETKPIEEDNPAVQFWFGTAKDDDSGQIGRVLIDDVYLPKGDISTKVMHHVKIDRLTGGASQGALFQEKSLSSNNTTVIIPIWLHVPNQEQPNDYKLYLEAIEKAIEDINSGQLALGGATTKGYGTFTHV